MKTLALSVVLLTASCGSNAGTSSEADAGIDAPEITGVGTSCATGCAGTDVCANESDECEHGYCLFDGRGDFDSYCTLDCSETSCPVGYHCESISFSIERACVADEKVCGNGIRERGEICDDGNTTSQDGCRADCAELDTPLDEQRRLSVTMTVSGSYVPKGGIATPFTMSAEVDSQLQSQTGCGSTGGASSGTSPTPWVSLFAIGCSNDITTRLRFTTPFIVGTYPTAGGEHRPRVCANLTLPPPDEANLVFCAQSDAENLIVETASADPLQASGSFTATLTYLPDESIGGCDGLYAPNSCPQETPATITVSASYAASLPE